MLAIKVFLAPIFIVFAYFIQRKYGPKIGGIFGVLFFPLLLIVT